MDSQHAKQILLSYQPGVAADGDPELQAALEQARRDPELRRWLEQHCAVQAAIGGEIKKAPLPPRLQGKKFAGESASRENRPLGKPRLLSAAAGTLQRR